MKMKVFIEKDRAKLHSRVSFFLLDMGSKINVLDIKHQVSYEDKEYRTTVLYDLKHETTK